MPSILRSAVRQEIVAIFETLVTGTATAGGATTLADTVQLVNYADSALVGKRVFIYSGTGIGQERRITANTQTTGSVTVPAWTTTPAIGDSYEIHSMFHIGDINRAINRAIADIRSDTGSLVDIVPDTSITLVAGTWAYTLVPAGLRFIHEILIEGTPLATGVYDMRNPIPSDFYRIEKTAQATSSLEATQQIIFDRERFSPTAGHHLKILGSQVQPSLTADTSLLAERLETYVVHRAAYYLLAPRGRGGSPAAQQVWKESQLHYQESEQARTRAPYVPPPGAQEIAW